VVKKRLPANHPFTGWLAPSGKLLAGGQTLRRSALARTLKRIRTKGVAGFYTGPVAQDIAGAVKAAGGVLTIDDLGAYTVQDRDPIFTNWRDLRLAAMPLPSSGGIALYEMLGIVDATGIDLSSLGHNSSASLHVIAEVLKHAFADRARFLGDADSANAAVGKLLDPARLARLAKRINKARVRKPAEYGDKAVGAARPVKSDGGTSHLCVIDAEGNAVALTTTVNGLFGAKLLAPRSGVLLNNQIDDFALEPGRANQFGLVQSAANLVGPGKRPLSSMTPLLVFRGDQVVGCLGGSGGPRIISSVFQVLLNVYELGMNARQAVDAPRIHHQWSPQQLEVEPEIARDVVDGLKRRGHKVAPSEDTAEVQLIVVRPDGVREAAADPRKGGEPAVQR
jgi:gamma-glutamyltranspeptidase/glutathione hydrolase